ncbi:agip9 [Agrotis ipsilon multiple nucleopolyhedrovirus]|uniref:Occlusion-derived virus envelope protein ODV-E56 n=1 Tax=Agrotis ipsilon multiple nucleopolyhedrovirus TaxID=208013 RepID=B6D5S3_9ABAC|nr:agip9 [Agrotis ipsilon multiple nucleopolyhedrovirus]ACI28711.1 occlusion-derived virus envelope protein ODV-E56 [Agrotis ipsilon multiple nucleopolyhedrovirus]
MSSFFRPLRNINKSYLTPTSFIADANTVFNAAPTGFRNALNNPVTVPIGNGRYRPGYNLPNNDFIPTSQLNTVMRNNDTTGMRRIFGNNPTNNDYTAMNRLRGADNVPDANMHSKQLKRNAVKDNFPDTRTRTPDGVENTLNKNPRLKSALETMKTGGIVTLIGVGVYFTFSAATLIQDIIEAINRTGGSYHTTGMNGGDQVEVCLLRHRTCRMPEIDGTVTVCDVDPLLPNGPELQNICQGFNYEAEQSVCRASDPNADEQSPQYVDISTLSADQMITCIEPYDFGDLIADLGLDNLLGEEGLITKSSNKSKSISDSLLPAILMIGAIILIVLIGWFIFKRLGNRQTINLEPVPTAVPLTTVPIQVR